MGETEEAMFQSRRGVIFSEDKVGGTVDGLIVGGAQVCSRRLQLDSPRRLIKPSGWYYTDSATKPTNEQHIMEPFPSKEV